jgi:hypothetical protein
MTSHVNALYAAEIAKFRHQYVTDAALAVLDAGHPADVVRAASFHAGLQWDKEHPHLAARVGEVQR